MTKYALSFELTTDLDPSQLLDLLMEMANDLVVHVEAHGGAVEDPDLPDVTACVKEK
jgi:hypothetical protein